MSSVVPRAVAVYCGSSLGKQEEFKKAALSVGHALAKADRPLVYGGGSSGIMGVVSSAVLDAGGSVTGVVPVAMVEAGGEGAKSADAAKAHGATVVLNEKGHEQVETVLVSSMHERKVEMAQRSGGFVGLPGGFGTFEEVLEVTTWTQIGIHSKPVVLVNVLSYWEPLRTLINNAVTEGFIRPKNERIVIFVDGPADHAEHAGYDWGKAVIDALDSWQPDAVAQYAYKWS